MSQDNADVVRKMLADRSGGGIDSWPSVRTEVDEVRTVDEERVLSFFRYVVTSGENHRPFETAVAAIHTVRDGRVMRVQIFRTREEALEAAGLSE